MSLFNHFDIQLTQDQQLAVDLLGTFLNSKEQCFLLRGYAGTGKTTIVKGLLSYLNGQGLPIRLLAPTGRAAMILGDKTQGEASTIHRGIYDLEDFDDDDHTFRIRFHLRSNGDPTNTVYLIDESSMISDVFNDDEFFIFGSGCLLKDFLDFVDLPYRQDAKIIFIGDRAQLPPVNMAFSPALDEGYLLHTYRINCQQYELSEVVRQSSDSDILQTATDIRTRLSSGDFSEFQIHTAHADTEHCKPELFLDSYFNSTDNAASDERIVITHSNYHAQMYNQMIRARLFENPTNIQPKDLVISTRNNYNHSVQVFNGQFATVIEVQSEPEMRKVRFKKKGGDTIEVRLLFRDLVLELEDFKRQKSLLRCKILINILDSPEPKITQDEQQGLYVDFKQRYPDLKAGTKEFRNALKKDPYFNALQIKYGYAITCHKAQGGEWPYVFVEFRTTMAVASKGFHRWAYTAITRGKEHLWAIGATERTAFSEYIVHPVARVNKAPANQYHVPDIFYSQQIDMEFPDPLCKEFYLQIRAKLDDDLIDIEITHFQYQERYTFSRNGETAIFNYSYSKKGFSHRGTLVSTTNQQFASEIDEILAQPLFFSVDHLPQTTGQKNLHELMTGVCETVGTPITNIEYHQYHDRYFVLTDAEAAYLDWYRNDKGIYTSVRPGSTEGDADETHPRRQS